MARPARDPETQRKALGLLARGYSPGEIAKHAGVSPQLVAEWGKYALIDWKRVRALDIANAWRNEDKVRRRPPTKRELRRQAARAKAQWDKDHAKAPNAG